MGVRGVDRVDIAYTPETDRTGKYQIGLYGLVITILGPVLYKGVLIRAMYVYRRKRDSSGHVYLRKRCFCKMRPKK